MTASEINRAIASIDKLSSKLNDTIIARGDGHLKLSTLIKRKDKIAKQLDELHKARHNLQTEIRKRYGPGYYKAPVKENPMRKTRAKRNRSPAQRANDKRLGEMARARAGKRRKKAKRNPRRSLKKDHLWIIFGVNGRTVKFARTLRQLGFTDDKGKALLFQSQDEALKGADEMQRYYSPKVHIGIAPVSTSLSDILGHVTGKK